MVQERYNRAIEKIQKAREVIAHACSELDNTLPASHRFELRKQWAGIDHHIANTINLIRTAQPKDFRE